MRGSWGFIFINQLLPHPSSHFSNAQTQSNQTHSDVHLSLPIKKEKEKKLQSQSNQNSIDIVSIHLYHQKSNIKKKESKTYIKQEEKSERKQVTHRNL